MKTIYHIRRGMLKVRKIGILLAVAVIIGASGYLYLRSVPPAHQRQLPTPSQNLPQEDKLAKSQKRAVEEDINGYGLENDLKITQNTQDHKKHRVLSLNQEEQVRLLKNISPNQMNDVLQVYNTTLPEGISDQVQYFDFKISFDYFLITGENGGEIRENPATDAPVICRVNYLDKVTLLQQAQGQDFQGSDIWYRVACSHGDKTKEGYLHSSTGIPRTFRFDKMQAAAQDLRQQLAKGALHFIRNYKNQYGAPPKKGETATDEFGYRFYHSAPAYEQADAASNFRYIPDGMLVRLLNETGDFYHISVPTFGGEYYVPKQYLDPSVTLSTLNHVVVVDRNQQNQAAFTVNEKGLNLVSYTLSTTGIPGDYSFETTLGSFKAIEKKDRFEYLQKGTSEIGGYAPFAIRFTGGAYIHGVPVAYVEQGGKKVDPGPTEYLHTIGTYPRSNMCVRNFTSHARFLYNWMDYKNGAVIVIE
ncbi:L,D-transpeptidase family protein [Dehalobacterium formicoaceticum]|uniref:L,D-transpeptidase family protein n=1 Tax=Dehalobacterium formicoaceticum TaxID=51515 RepID=A0ABT1Y3Z0_9FIRM|nr:L,D-transpeptidase family protein [Dehalobacterium formicoaceticum]MCR6545592.1 L,D-transpeptidase family protein [Dehalobacterium formicoaceticum]